MTILRHGCFNTQPPEGGWLVHRASFIGTAVSTRSRLKAAGVYGLLEPVKAGRFQHAAA